MPVRTQDPSKLSGEELVRWYRRSALDVERERRERDVQAWDEFTSDTRRSLQAPAEAIAIPGDDLWIAKGDGGWRPIHSRSGHGESDVEGAKGSANASEFEDYEASEIGNPANRRLKEEHIRKYGFWPRTEDGRPYDVGHIKAIADGGTNTLDNIRPIHPEEHREAHIRDGDFGRWSKRAGIARAFGGRVVRGLGVLSLLPTVTGMLSGRIRTDTFDNMASDMMGQPSREDRQKQIEREQKAFNPKWKPGDPVFI